MKRILLIAILLVPFMSYSQKTYVPDDILEAWFEANGYGDSIAYNDSVLTASINTITYLPLQIRIFMMLLELKRYNHYKILILKIII